MSREPGYGDDDRLPWLETVEEDYREGPSFGRILLLIFLLLLVIGAAAGGYYWYQQQQGLTGNGQLINAQEGDYKVKPDEPGGQIVEGEGDTVFSTSQGNASNATINAGAMPEAPGSTRGSSHKWLKPGMPSSLRKSSLPPQPTKSRCGL